jgi:hypothetical protein
MRVNKRLIAIVGAVVVAAVAAVVVIVVTSGGGAVKTTGVAKGGGPRPVTSEEAERLATMGVKDYQDVGVAFHALIVSPQGTVALNGDVDFHAVAGYGEVSGGKGRSFTLEWDGAALIAWPSKGKPTTPPETVPVSAPRERALAPSTSSVDTVLAVLLGLGERQPDDAKQVQKGGARWLGTSKIDGKTVDVMQGPSAKGPGHGSDTSLDFWVDESGNLLRVDIYLNGSTTPTQVDLDPSTYAPVRISPYLTGNGAS